MTISRAGTASGTTTVTIPTHNIGDLIVIFGFRSANTGGVTVPSGFTSLRTQVGTGCSASVGYKLATSNTDTSGTWTNASKTMCIVYTPTLGTTTICNILNNNGTSGTSNTITYPATTGFAINGRSWILAFVGKVVAATFTAPTGLTNQLANTTSPGAAILDSNGSFGATVFSSRTAASNATGNNISFTLEVVDQRANGWDPLNTGRGALNTTALETFANTDDQTLTLTGSGSTHDATATTGHNSGKYYFEMTCVTPGSNGGGIGAEGGTGGAAALFWIDVTGTFGNSSGGVGSNSMTSAISGDVCGICVDCTNGLVWIKDITSNTSWNGNVSADPVANVGGLPTGFTGTTMYPVIGAGVSGTSEWTLNTGMLNFQGPVPSNFLPWYVPPTSAYVPHFPYLRRPLLRR